MVYSCFDFDSHGKRKTARIPLEEYLSLLKIYYMILLKHVLKLLMDINVAGKEGFLSEAHPSPSSASESSSKLCPSEGMRCPGGGLDLGFSKLR